MYIKAQYGYHSRILTFRNRIMALNFLLTFEAKCDVVIQFLMGYLLSVLHLETATGVLANTIPAKRSNHGHISPWFKHRLITLTILSDCLAALASDIQYVLID